MITLISPAKTLDFERDISCNEYSIPENLDKSEQLVGTLKRKSRKQLSELMNISPKLAGLNHDRFQEWNIPFTMDNARQAVFVFKGDVYAGLDIDRFLLEDLKYTQDHLRILSGLHGMLRPLDLIKPYRLEMGIRLKYRRKNNLYEFWGDTITNQLKETLEPEGSGILVNLASDEYFKSIDTKKLGARIITPVFMDFKNGEYKLISFFFKKARGMMARYILLNRIEDAEQLKMFDEEGYMYNDQLSEGDRLVFTRG
ncbi:MAG: peroxide stress protein YaaA [bacterium]